MKIRAMVCSGGLERILYALSVTCRSVLIIERGKVRAECEARVWMQTVLMPSLPLQHSLVDQTNYIRKNNHWTLKVF